MPHATSDAGQDPGGVDVVRASEGDLDTLVPLFDSYRQFYHQASNLEGARAFLGERLRLGDATIFLARVAGLPAGFAQLYPSFSSVRLGRLWILNDLFVTPGMRRRGVGTALLRRARAHAQSTAAVAMMLRTAHDNTTAQAAYEAEGWARENTFLTYTIGL